MRAVRLSEPGGPLKVEKVPVPSPGKGELLIKMQFSPVNPSDLALIRRGYLDRTYPFTPGLEGSGRVIASGGGVMGRVRLGKEVACSPGTKNDGTWAEYMVTTAFNVAPLPSGISPEQGSMMLVNPMTAMAFLQMAREGHHRAVINTAAASSLGRMLIRLCNHYGLPLINIVRRPGQVEELKQVGATHILDSESDSFPDDLASVARDLRATLLLDAIAGEQSARLLAAAPEGAVMVNYARLSEDPVTAEPSDLMMKGKQVRGFQLGAWLSGKSLLFKLRFIRKVKKHMKRELQSEIRQVFPMEQVNEAIDRYTRQMTGGKVILQLYEE